MEIKSFLDTVCNQIKYKPARNEIAEELQLHIEDIKDSYLCKGYQEKEAEEKAIEQMGKAEEIGKKLNKIHRPQLDWKLVILICVLICFGFLVALNRGFETIADPERVSNYIETTLSATFGAYIFTLIIGGISSAVIYFTDYRKISKYSFHIYLLATVLNIVADIFGIDIGGNVLWGLPIIQVSPIVITIPLYIISFVGFINNQIKSDEKRFSKIIVLSIISIISLIRINFESALVVAVTYAIISTMQLLKLSQNKIKNIIKVWIIPVIMLLVFIFGIMIALNSKYTSESFTQESQIINEAKLFGRIETINVNRTFFAKNTSFAFLSLLGNYGWFISIAMIVAVILLNIKLILNARKIKDLYGKLIIISIAIIFILESSFSIIMNLLGLGTDFSIPFVSYGKVSLVINMMCLALVLSVYRRKKINIYNNESNLSFEKGDVKTYENKCHSGIIKRIYNVKFKNIITNINNIFDRLCDL